MLFVDDPVLQFCKLGAVPAVGRAYEVTGDALERIDVVAVAVRAFLESVSGVFIAAVEAAVAVVGRTALADVVFVHEVDDAHYSLRVVGGVSVDLHIEDMSGVLVLVVWSLDFSLVLRSAVEVYRNMA